MICNGCGGLVGRDCFNPQECEWISADMARRAMYEVEPDRADEEAAYYREQEAVFEAERFEATGMGCS